jgi:hypothetical protein
MNATSMTVSISPPLAVDLFGATPSEAPAALLVRLDRNVDREQPCCENIAIIHPGKPPHSAELRCATCNAHRGWLPQTVLNFITETTRRFGAPTEPITVRQQHKENTDMAFQQKPNRGSLFRNDEKSKEEDRDYAGSINIEGREYWLSGWINQTKKGSKYLSLAVKPKDEQSREKAKPKAGLREELDDAVPF